MERRAIQWQRESGRKQNILVGDEIWLFGFFLSLSKTVQLMCSLRYTAHQNEWSKWREDVSIHEIGFEKQANNGNSYQMQLLEENKRNKNANFRKLFHQMSFTLLCMLDKRMKCIKSMSSNESNYLLFSVWV